MARRGEDAPVLGSYRRWSAIGSRNENAAAIGKQVAAVSAPSLFEKKVPRPNLSLENM